MISANNKHKIYLHHETRSHNKISNKCLCLLSLSSLLILQHFTMKKSVRVWLHRLLLLSYKQIKHLRLDEEFNKVEVSFGLHGFQERFLLELTAVPATLEVLWEMPDSFEEDLEERLWHQPVYFICAGVVFACWEGKQDFLLQFSWQDRLLISYSCYEFCFGFSWQVDNQQL